MAGSIYGKPVPFKSVPMIYRTALGVFAHVIRTVSFVELLWGFCPLMPPDVSLEYASILSHAPSVLACLVAITHVGARVA